MFYKRIIDTRTWLSSVKHQIQEMRLKIDMRLDFEFTRFHLLFSHLKWKLKINSRKKKSPFIDFLREITSKRIHREKGLPRGESSSLWEKQKQDSRNEKTETVLCWRDRISFLSCLLFLCYYQSEKEEFRRHTGDQKEIETEKERPSHL